MDEAAEYLWVGRPLKYYSKEELIEIVYQLETKRRQFEDAAIKTLYPELSIKHPIGD